VGSPPDRPVHPGRRGRGLAATALKRLTTQAHRTGHTRLWLEINPTNTASLRVAERAGYTYEQRLPDHCLNHTTQTRHDCLIWIHET
jgi:RimJ/RimL family protein N-acetyltransferase